MERDLKPMAAIAAVAIGCVLGLAATTGPTDHQVAEATYQAHVDARKAARVEREACRVERIYKERAR